MIKLKQIMTLAPGVSHPDLLGGTAKPVWDASDTIQLVLAEGQFFIVGPTTVRVVPSWKVTGATAFENPLTAPLPQQPTLHKVSGGGGRR